MTPPPKNASKRNLAGVQTLIRDHMKKFSAALGFGATEGASPIPSHAIGQAQASGALIEKKGMSIVGSMAAIQSGITSFFASKNSGENQVAWEAARSKFTAAELQYLPPDGKFPETSEAQAAVLDKLEEECSALRCELLTNQRCADRLMDILGVDDLETAVAIVRAGRAEEMIRIAGQLKVAYGFCGLSVQTIRSLPEKDRAAALRNGLEMECERRAGGALAGFGFPAHLLPSTNHVDPDQLEASEMVQAYAKAKSPAEAAKIFSESLAPLIDRMTPPENAKR